MGTGSQARAAGGAPPPRRRTFLALLAFAAVPASTLAACTGGGSVDPPPTDATTPPTPDELAQQRAVESARGLLTLAGSVSAPSTAVSGLLPAIEQGQREHLAALGSPQPADATATSTGATTASGTPTPGGTPAAPAPARLVAAAAGAAQQAVDDVPGTTPGMATLLARIAAARALDARLLAVALGLRPPAPPTGPAAHGGTATATARATTTAPTTSPPSSPPTSSPTTTSPTTGSPTAGSPTALPDDVVDSLTRQLAGRHAAVFAYALVFAHLGGASRRQAGEMWAGHVDSRDALERRLLAAGAQPPVAEPAYDVGLVSTPADAVALAVRVERGLAAVAAADVGALEDEQRVDAALDLVEATQRIGRWTHTSEPLPGEPVAPERTPSTSAAASPPTSAPPSLTP